MRRRALHWLLAAALVFAQLGVQAHALSHLGKALSGQDGTFQQTSHDPATCLAFEAAAGGAVTPVRRFRSAAKRRLPSPGSPPPIRSFRPLRSLASRVGRHLSSPDPPVR